MGVGVSLRFEVLGPLRVCRDGAEIDLGPHKQRAALAFLLTRPNQPVPAHQIVEAVWAEAPPENGANVVQKYIGGLRKALDPGRSPREANHPLALTEAGYVLSVDAARLDLLEFQGFVRAAKVAREQGRSAEAADRLHRAMALWRSEPLAGFIGPAFDRVRDRLGEERVGAVEACGELDLNLGHHERLVPELRSLVAEYPYRERLRGLLMVALYRCGRAAEALEVFRSARRQYVDELGVEPGVELQDLHRRMLQSDPSLAGPPRTPASPPAGPRPPAFARPAPAMRVPMLAAPPVQQPKKPWWHWMLTFGAAAVCLGSLGFVTWLVMAVVAAFRRSWRLALAAAGYFAGLVVLIIAVRPETGQGLGMVIGIPSFMLITMGGAAHFVVLGFMHKANPVAR